MRQYFTVVTCFLVTWSRTKCVLRAIRLRHVTTIKLTGNAWEKARIKRNNYLPSPLSNDEGAKEQKRALFASLNLGEGGGVQVFHIFCKECYETLSSEQGEKKREKKTSKKASRHRVFSCLLVLRDTHFIFSCKNTGKRPFK